MTSNRMFATLKGEAEEEQKKSNLVVIEYPAIVKNLDKALERLGGLAQISSNHFANRALELRHTPSNPYTSCLVAERKNEENVTSGTLRLVMKIRRHKKKPDEPMKIEFLGLVQHVYSFESMCDFQYLPLKKKPDVPEEAFDDLIPQLIPTDLGSALSWWARADVPPTPLFLPPYQFSRYSTPSQKILAKETDFGVDKCKKAKLTGFGQNLRTERKALSITVLATDEFPISPLPEAVADTNSRCKNEEPHRLLEELFNERPMWTRIAILFRTGLEDSLLRSLLQKFAFYIQSGPWGRLWCRFGYDPRVTSDSACYQTLMVSFRQHMKIPERQRLKVSSERTPAASVAASGATIAYATPASAASANEPIAYTYEPGRLPRVRQMWYSIMDVKLPEAEKVLTMEFDTSNVATEGWIKSESIDMIRNAIKEDVKLTTKGMDVVEDDGEIFDDF
ncbi:unnamed protein product [Caenorhabditis auriculariae]|uniref:General transcription factor 3C polypeptide 5 n=1 Tax=Caenorhabditis auriculariae TaxID=2777116 RepID=A0A8S1HA38_9PELO|nr:unnamed protein product [Caenorhabditis auriculariae]